MSTRSSADRLHLLPDRSGNRQRRVPRVRIPAGEAKRLLDLLEGRPARDARDSLYELFAQLRDDFNGDLFEGDLEAEKLLIEEPHVDVIRRFLRGDDLVRGQMSLGFWAYDFSVIPIETISGIYELFLGAEDEDRETEVRRYYTPRFLAEVVIDLALLGWKTFLDKRFLDPACGSGIFLVGIFNRLAEEWRRKNRKAENDERAASLIEILKTNIFGIDVNETACRIAAFSLYLPSWTSYPRETSEISRRGERPSRSSCCADGEAGR